MKIFLFTLLLILMTACGGGKYSVSIEKEGDLMIIDKAKAKEFLLNYDKLYGKTSIPSYYYPGKFDKLKPSIGLIIKYEGKIRLPGNLVNVIIYPIHNQIKKYDDSIFYHDIKPHHAFYIIPDEMLKKLNILDESGHITDGIIIESADQTNKKIPHDKYIIKLSKEELNSVHDTIFTQKGL